MRRKVYNLIAILGLLLVVTAASAQAQTHIDGIVKVNVPFAFSVGDKSFPAGEYTVRRVSQGSDSFFIQSRETNEVQSILTVGKIKANSGDLQAKLVFNNHNGSYFLSQVWTPASSNGNELKMTKMERELAKNERNALTVAVVAQR
jgi:hypothetical protein